MHAQKRCESVELCGCEEMVCSPSVGASTPYCEAGQTRYVSRRISPMAERDVVVSTGTRRLSYRLNLAWAQVISSNFLLQIDEERVVSNVKPDGRVPAGRYVLRFRPSMYMLFPSSASLALSALEYISPRQTPTRSRGIFRRALRSLPCMYRQIPPNPIPPAHTRAPEDNASATARCRSCTVQPFRA